MVYLEADWLRRRRHLRLWNHRAWVTGNTRVAAAAAANGGGVQLRLDESVLRKELVQR